jgi:hypothetical protein
LVLRMDSGQGAQVLPVEREAVEGVELHLVVMAARVQGVEVGDTIDAQDHGLAIDDEPLVPVPERAFDDQGITVGAVVTAASDQPDAIAVPLQPETVAVILHLVEPIRAGGNACRLGRQAELKGLKHAPKIGTLG